MAARARERRDAVHRLHPAGLLLVAALFACAPPPGASGVTDAVLAPCPSSPNCVSSDAQDVSHGVAPFELTAKAPEAWKAAEAAVAALPRTHIVKRSDDFLHAECRSALFRFVDDLELELRPERGVIAVRSASRVGYWDLGVNRRRVEELRAALQRRGVVR